MALLHSMAAGPVLAAGRIGARGRVGMRMAPSVLSDIGRGSQNRVVSGGLGWGARVGGGGSSAAPLGTGLLNKMTSIPGASSLYVPPVPPSPWSTGFRKRVSYLGHPAVLRRFPVGTQAAYNRGRRRAIAIGGGAMVISASHHLSSGRRGLTGNSSGGVTGMYGY